MPQPDGEIQIPRPVVPEPAPGNDAPGPQAGQQAYQLTVEEKLEVNVSVVSTRIIRMVFIVFFSFLGGRGCFSFHVPLLLFFCSSLVCDVFVVLHVAGLCNVIMYRRLSLGASGVCLLVLSSMSFGVPCCYFPRSWVFGLYIRIIL